jgi:hypothetical protein
MDHQEDDVRWDYDAPQFVDFTAPIPFNDGADKMFGKFKLSSSSEVDQHLTTEQAKFNFIIKFKLMYQLSLLEIS